MLNLKIVDLSFSIEEGMPYFPSKNHIPFSKEVLGDLVADGRVTHQLVIGTHCGTHVDAFSHFEASGENIDQIDLHQLTGRAELVNLGRLEPGAKIGAEMLSDLLPDGKYGKIILRSDWSRFWKTDQYYQDWPYLSGDAVRFLIGKKIHLLGMDFPSPDKTSETVVSELDSPGHKSFFKNKIVLLEYLTNLDQLPVGKIFLMAMPLKLTGMDGAPARVAAYSINN